MNQSAGKSSHHFLNRKKIKKDATATYGTKNSRATTIQQITSVQELSDAYKAIKKETEEWE